MNDKIRAELEKIEELTIALRSALETDRMTDAEESAHSLSRVAEALDDVLKNTRMNAQMEAMGFGWIKEGAKAWWVTGKAVEITDVNPLGWTAWIRFDGDAQRIVFFNALQPVE